MTVKTIAAGTLALAAALAAQSATAASRAAPVAAFVPSFVKAAPIRAPDDRWDFASWDPARGLLVVAHGRDVLLIDPARGGTVRAIGALQGAHGAVAIPGSDHLIVSSAHDDTARILDIRTGAQIASIPVAGDPDAVILSADARFAYVMGARAGAISIVDLAANAEAGRIALKEALEVPVLVTPTLVAVNNEAAGEIEFADLATRRPAGTIALAGCEGPTGLAYDPQSGLALSACANGRAALVDLRARKLVRLLPIGLGPDTVIWDARHGRFLVPCGKSGTLSVIRLAGGSATVEPAVVTEPSARTGALDPATGRVYLPAARFGPAAAPGKRGPIEPGSFHVVVLVPRA